MLEQFILEIFYPLYFLYAIIVLPYNIKQNKGSPHKKGLNDIKVHSLTRFGILQGLKKRKKYIDLFESVLTTKSYSNFIINHVLGHRYVLDKHIEYIFDEEETWKSGCYNGKEGEPCSKSDIVQVINAPLIIANEIIQSLPKIPLKFKPFTTLPSFLLEVMDILLFDPFWCEKQPQRRNQTPHCDDLFYNAAVDDLLWQGHNPGIMKLFFSVLDSFEQIIAELGIDIKLDDFLPMQLSGRTLGFYKGKNQTKLGNYRMINNGNLVHEKYLNIEELNGNSELPESWWPHIAPTPSAKDSGIKGNYSFK